MIDSLLCIRFWESKEKEPKIAVLKRIKVKWETYDKQALGV